MKKITAIVLTISSLIYGVSCTQQQLTSFQNGALANGGALTESEIVRGLKEALQVGITNGAENASKTDGYYLNPLIKIPFPPDVVRVESALRKVGLGNQVDNFVLTLNRGAEDAAKKATPIFIKAIFSMSFSDAIGILKGNHDAATQFLKRTTTAALLNEFAPVIEQSLAKTQATHYYSEIANVYNEIPFTQKINPNLTQYASQRAIDGLFVLVAQEEAKIRENPAARVTDILKRVFGAS